MSMIEAEFILTIYRLLSKRDMSNFRIATYENTGEVCGFVQVAGDDGIIVSFITFKDDEDRFSELL